MLLTDPRRSYQSCYCTACLPGSLPPSLILLPPFCLYSFTHSLLPFSCLCLPYSLRPLLPPSLPACQASFHPFSSLPVAFTPFPTPPFPLHLPPLHIQDPVACLPASLSFTFPIPCPLPHSLPASASLNYSPRPAEKNLVAGGTILTWRLEEVTFFNSRINWGGNEENWQVTGSRLDWKLQKVNNVLKDEDWNNYCELKLH